MKTKLTLNIETDLMQKLIQKKKETGIPISFQIEKAVETYFK